MKTIAENRSGGLLRELRRRIYETGLQLQTMEQGNEDHLVDVMERLHGLTGFGLLTANEEKKALFPSLVIAAPFMVSLLEKELEMTTSLAEKLNSLVDDFEDCFSATEKRDAFRMIQRIFEEWAGSVLLHLNRISMMTEDLQAEQPEEKRVLSLVA